jgi:Na+-driven multidrug efflux pump
MYSIADSLILFFTAMNENIIVLGLQILIIPIHSLSCWLLIPKYGIQGAGYAANITSFLTVTS